MTNKTLKYFLFGVLVWLTCFSAMGQIPTPGGTQKGSVLLKGGIIHIGNGKVINQGSIGFENGVITEVSENPNVSDFDTVIDVKGSHVYPGFISANSTLGMTEIDAVRASSDHDETGLMLPHIRSIIAYNTDSRITPTVRTNGVLLAQVCPRGGIISGTSSIVQLDAWNWEDAIVQADDGVHLNFPRIKSKSGWWAEPGSIKSNDKFEKQVQELDGFMKAAFAYFNEKEHASINLLYEACSGLFSGEKTLYLHATYVKEIILALGYSDYWDIPHIVLVGGYDSWRVSEELVKRDIPVILRRVHELPLRPEEDIDLPYKLPFLLKEAGVMFCLDTEGDMERMNTRNLPFYAGTARAYGLSDEDAVASISYHAAKILGIDKILGSLEVGKHATLFVSEGDALDIRTNKLTHAFISGRHVDLYNHQEALYDKYKNKYFPESK